jgi:hypothetical protein
MLTKLCSTQNGANMYSIRGFFIEILPERVPGDGWTADARFSLQSDYKRHGDVLKVTWSSHLNAATKGSVEIATLRWVRQFLESSSDVVLSDLRQSKIDIQEKREMQSKNRSPE